MRDKKKGKFRPGTLLPPVSLSSLSLSTQTSAQKDTQDTQLLGLDGREDQKKE